MKRKLTNSLIITISALTLIIPQAYGAIIPSSKAEKKAQQSQKVVKISAPKENLQQNTQVVKTDYTPKDLADVFKSNEPPEVTPALIEATNKFCQAKIKELEKLKGPSSLLYIRNLNLRNQSRMRNYKAIGNLIRSFNDYATNNIEKVKGITALKDQSRNLRSHYTHCVMDYQYIAALITWAKGWTPKDKFKTSAERNMAYKLTIDSNQEYAPPKEK